VASSEALSAAFAEPEEAEGGESIESAALTEATSVEPEVATKASEGELEEAPAEVSDELSAAPIAEPTEPPLEEAPVVEPEALGLTDDGRAVNDPRISPKPVTDTAVSTEQAELFALPTASPVAVVQQDAPRASNDPRGARSAGSV
jgi:ribonuclease E